MYLVAIHAHSDHFSLAYVEACFTIQVCAVLHELFFLQMYEIF